MKLNLFSKIFIITFVIFLSVLFIYMYELRESQKNSLLKNIEIKANSLGDTITFINSDNMIIDDEVKILESLLNYVTLNKDIQNLVLSKKDDYQLLVKPNGWSQLENKLKEKRLNNSIKKSIFTDEIVYRHKYPILFSGIQWGFLYFELSVDEYNEQLKEMNKQFSILILIMLISSFFISYILARIISKPIIKLNNISNLISKGDLSQRVDIERKDEIGTLANSFNNMVENLEKSQNKLKNYQLDLEKEVEERTKELKELNDTLELRVNSEITKRQEQEQLLIQQSKLASMGEMIGNIAHQWRQPLNALGLVVQNIKFAYDFDELDDQFMDTSIEKVNRLTKNMSKTIDDFRNFFKPNKEKIAFNLDKIINETLELVDSTFENHNIDIKKDIEKDIKVFGFPNEFLQTMLNIMNNAKDAYIENNIVNGKLHLKVNKSTDFAHVTIRDNAGGIPKDIRDKIFDPYFTTKEEGRGTGIGLYMSKIIIEQNMNGKLISESIENGTIFIISLPLYKD
ncbi:HAMP domain-containing sensor histidine kinase [Halarcobacter sp.]|uniref:HAMP domain-containing sensor histidine kinase n=1 Tax=Halarcobacter sp. TaxID=2321133 RepID=UPI002AAB9FC4|nr:HAMP domain-containing sensor histidine kinase [Halarcobacter sp.]